jgi:signal transduction histidine kinase
LKQALSEVDQKLIEAQKQVQQTVLSTSTDNIEMLASITQELRQPMSSVLGYTDLLLGESVGILGALQRKFLERIKASTERMEGLVDDLVQATTRDKLSLTPAAVDLSLIIDEAIVFCAARLREKNITLRLDLPEQLPQMNADRDALQQILIHLLQNAGAATPNDGEISLRARMEARENEPAYMLLQVSDTGVGISPEDLPRVFSRLYRADNPLIKGVGDTGVGLSIVKTLVEALGGRIWVDSEPEQGATYSVLLPLNPYGNGANLPGGTLV